MMLRHLWIAVFVILIAACSDEFNEELNVMASNDQNERLSGQMNSINDQFRIERVFELEKAGQIINSTDFYNAAIILQHGNEPIHFLKAHIFSMKAYELDSSNTNALRLSCASEDRYLLSIGKPQIWGTQFHVENGRQIKQEPYLKWAKSDEDKALCGLH